MKRTKITRPQIFGTVAMVLGGVLLYVLFTWGISTNPPGFYVDEACVAYNGYHIAMTGAQAEGPRFPLYVQCFTGGTIGPTSPYAMALLYLFVPPSTFSARMCAATVQFIAILLLGFLAYRITRRAAIGAVVTVLGALTPWLIETGRLVFETWTLLFFLALFLYLLYGVYERDRWRLRDQMLIALSLSGITYSYSAGRMLAPLFAFGLLIFVRSRRSLLDTFLTWCIYGLTLIPAFIVYLKDPLVFTSRFATATNLSRSNGFVENAWTVISALCEDMGLKFFVFVGDQHIRHHVPGMGEFLVGMFALGLFGPVITLIRHRNNAWWWFILYGAIVSMLPGAITFERYHSIRNAAFPIFFLLLTVPGIQWLFETREASPIGAGSNWLNRNERFLRWGLLASLLVLTLVQAVQFQWIFRRDGVSAERQNDFYARYPVMLQKALDTGGRPIYVADDDTWVLGYWYGAEWGLDRSNFFHLDKKQQPPAGSVVISSNAPSGQIEILDSGAEGLFIYRTLNPPAPGTEVTGPAALPTQAAGEPKNLFAHNRGSRYGELLGPRGLFVDGSGNICIADTENARVQKFDSEGRFVSAIDTGVSPFGIAVDASGNVYFTDSPNHTLVKFGADGNFQTRLTGPAGGFYGPRDIALGPNNKLYVVDQGRARITRFDLANQAFDLEWGSAGSGESQFNEAYGITVAGDRVVVADVGNHRIQVFDLEGHFVRQWAVPVWQQSSSEFPDVVFDEQAQRYYATSGGTEQILSFDINGTRLDDLVVGSLANPSALAILDTSKARWLLIVNSRDSSITRVELKP